MVVLFLLPVSHFAVIHFHGSWFGGDLGFGIGNFGEKSGNSPVHS